MFSVGRMIRLSDKERVWLKDLLQEYQNQQTDAEEATIGDAFPSFDGEDGLLPQTAYIEEQIGMCRKMLAKL